MSVDDYEADTESGDWLTSDHIRLAIQLVKTVLPNKTGLLNTLQLQQPSKLTSLPPGSIQVHFVGGNHWVTSAYDGSCVKVYDSKYNGTLRKDFQGQPRALYKHKEVIGSQDTKSPTA